MALCLQVQISGSMAQPVVSLAVAQAQGLPLTSPTMLHQQQPLTAQLQQQPTAITAQLQQQPATITAQIQQQQQRVILPPNQRSEAVAVITCGVGV